MVKHKSTPLTADQIRKKLKRLQDVCSTLTTLHLVFLGAVIFTMLFLIPPFLSPAFPAAIVFGCLTAACILGMCSFGGTLIYRDSAEKELIAQLKKVTANQTKSAEPKKSPTTDIQATTDIQSSTNNIEATSAQNHTTPKGNPPAYAVVDPYPKPVEQMGELPAYSKQLPEGHGFLGKGPDIGVVDHLPSYDDVVRSTSQARPTTTPRYNALVESTPPVVLTTRPRVRSSAFRHNHHRPPSPVMPTIALISRGRIRMNGW